MNKTVEEHVSSIKDMSHLLANASLEEYIENIDMVKALSDAISGKIKLIEQLTK